jgi:hypothetical protein
VSVFHNATAYDNVFAGSIPTKTVLVAARFNGDAIVSGVEEAIFYQYIFAGFGITAVVVGSMAFYGYPSDYYVFAKQRM